MKTVIVAAIFCLPLILTVDSLADDVVVPEAVAAGRGAVCPDGFEVAYDVVARYLSSPGTGMTNARQEAGTSVISVDDVRPLVDGEDEEVCQALGAMYGDYRGGRVRDVVCYEAGGFYFVPHPLTTREVEGMIIASGHHYFYVVNSDFEQIQALMM